MQLFQHPETKDIELTNRAAEGYVAVTDKAVYEAFAKEFPAARRMFQVKAMDIAEVVGDGAADIVSEAPLHVLTEAERVDVMKKAQSKNGNKR